MKRIHTFESFLNEGFVKQYGARVSQEEFESYEVGKIVLYKGTQYEIIENTGTTLILKPVKGTGTTMVNLNMFIQGGAIVESVVNEAEDDKVTLNVTISNIDKETSEDFLKMFAFMEWCGNVGTARTMRGFFDGDGHFRPDIKVEGVDLKKIDLGLEDKDKEIDLDLGFGA